MTTSGVMRTINVKDQEIRQHDYEEHELWELIKVVIVVSTDIVVDDIRDCSEVVKVAPADDSDIRTDCVDVD